jgi:hypothetical protein
MSVGLTDIMIQHEDDAVKSEYRDVFEFLNMEEIIRQLWLCVEVYGMAVPLEFWDKKNPLGITPLNPKNIYIEPYYDVGIRPLFFVPSKKSRENLIKNQTFLNSVVPDWNEYSISENGFALNPDNSMLIQHMKLPGQIYAIPPLVRAQRSISTRMMLEEMIRATIEGVKNQIIIWTIENPQPRETKALEAKLTANRSARVGHLVWRKGLEAKQLIPGSVDALLANDTWARLTYDVFRKMGASVRTISGEVSGVGQASDFEIDIQLFVERLRIPRRRILYWLNRWSRKYAELNGIKTAPIITMRDITLEVQMAIRNKLVPLMNFGFPSVDTILETAGFQPEIERKKMEEDDKGIRKVIKPYAGFSQTAVSKSGEKKTTTSRQSGGRPVGKIGNDETG